MRQIDKMKQEYIAEWNALGLDFDDFEYRKIYDWIVSKGGGVTWEESFVDGRGNKTVNKRFAHWTFYWKFGFLGFEKFKEDEEEKAIKTACLFVYLWLKGVKADIADHCAEAYCKNYTFSRG